MRLPGLISIRWKRFSLRTLLLLTGAACVLLGVWSAYVLPYRRQAFAMQIVSERGGRCSVQGAEGPPWHRWLVTILLGDGKFVDLISIDLRGAKSVDSTLQKIGGLRALQELTLDRSDVTNQGLANLAGMAHLERISLRYTGITDAGLSECASLPLRHLLLTGTRVTDESIPALEKLQTLDELFIRWTEITGAGEDRLRATLPRAAIYHERGALESNEKDWVAGAL
jgi:hypothetical protein